MSERRPARGVGPRPAAAALSGLPPSSVPPARAPPQPMTSLPHPLDHPKCKCDAPALQVGAVSGLGRQRGGGGRRRRRPVGTAPMPGPGTQRGGRARAHAPAHRPRPRWAPSPSAAQPRPGACHGSRRAHSGVRALHGPRVRQLLPCSADRRVPAGPGALIGAPRWRPRPLRFIPHTTTPPPARPNRPIPPTTTPRPAPPRGRPRVGPRRSQGRPAACRGRQKPWTCRRGSSRR
jgi:hypothetical protein